MPGSEDVLPYLKDVAGAGGGWRGVLGRGCKVRLSVALLVFLAAATPARCIPAKLCLSHVVWL